MQANHAKQCIRVFRHQGNMQCNELNRINTFMLLNCNETCKSIKIYYINTFVFVYYNGLRFWFHDKWFSFFCMIACILLFQVQDLNTYVIASHVFSIYILKLWWTTIHDYYIACFRTCMFLNLLCLRYWIAMLDISSVVTNEYNCIWIVHEYFAWFLDYFLQCRYPCCMFSCFFNLPR